MNIVFLASPSLNIQLGDYVPLMIVCGVLAVLFVVFKLTGVRSKVLWTLLINGMIGAAMLSLFSIVFYSYLNMKFFKVPIDWIPFADLGSARRARSAAAAHPQITAIIGVNKWKRSRTYALTKTATR